MRAGSFRAYAEIAADTKRAGEPVGGWPLLRQVRPWRIAVDALGRNERPATQMLRGIDGFIFPGREPRSSPAPCPCAASSNPRFDRLEAAADRLVEEFSEEFSAWAEATR